MSASSVAWTITDLVVRGIMIKPSFIIWVIACCLARRRHDPARTAFSWLKAAFPTFMLSIFFICAADIVAIVLAELADNNFYDDDGSYGDDQSTLITLESVSDRVWTVGFLFDYITDALVVICLVELGLGFLYILQKGRTSMQKILRIGILVVGAIVVIFAAAEVGLYNVAYNSYFDFEYNQGSVYDYETGTYVATPGEFDPTTYERDTTAGNDLEMAADVILMVISGATVGLAGYVLSQCSRLAPFIKSSAVLFLVASILNFIRGLWNVIFDGVWVLQPVVLPSAVSAVVNPILDEWTLFVVLTLVFVVGRRKIGGLWTTNQPWTQSDIAGPPTMMPQQTGGWQQGGKTWQQPAPMGGHQQMATGYPAGYMVPAPNGWQQHPSSVPQEQQQQQHLHETEQVSPQEWRESVAPGSPPPAAAPGYSPPVGELPSANGTYAHEVK